jgi:hypothetical protein
MPTPIVLRAIGRIVQDLLTNPVTLAFLRPFIVEHVAMAPRASRRKVDTGFRQKAMLNQTARAV